MEFAARLERISSFTTPGVFKQIVAANYLKSDRLPVTVDHALIVYRERAAFMGDAIDAYMGKLMCFRRPEGGLFAWDQLQDLAGVVHEGKNAADKAVRHKIAVLPRSLLHPGSEVVPVIRLSFATANASVIHDGIRLLADALGK